MKNWHQKREGGGGDKAIEWQELRKKDAYKSITIIANNRNKNISYVATESATNIATSKVNSVVKMRGAMISTVVES